jgi:hypothetical protein
VYPFNEDKKPDSDMTTAESWEKMGYVSCPFYDRVSWEELIGESLTHDVRHVNHVDHILHTVTTT